MNKENYPAYTMLTNAALSNALALECVIESYIDDQAADLLESAFYLANDQLVVVRNLREMADNSFIEDAIRLSARSVGVSVMVSALSDRVDEQTESEQRNELPEAILTMIQRCILIVKTIRCNITNG